MQYDPAQPRDPDNTWPVENQLVSIASHFSRVVIRAAKIPISPVSMRVLAKIDDSGPQRISHMACHESISQPAMTTAVNRLEADGLVARQPDPEDARAQLVTLTDRGLEMLEAFRHDIYVIMEPKFAALDPEDRAALLRSIAVLQRLTEDLTERPEPRKQLNQP